ncbi:uncharacterized protein LOC143622366 [Bidens hawaiensis]|uniref:uncharacterized protein LOC143622366 n=1 Tax=Bidens hawaiensis TaxID=980011 RepID=UPI0040494DD2
MAGEDQHHENQHFLLSSPDLDGFDVSPSDLDFPSPEFRISRHQRLSDQVNFVFDMISHQSSRAMVENHADPRVRVSTTDEGVMDLGNLDVDFGLRFALEDRNCIDDCGFRVSDWGNCDRNEPYLVDGFSVTESEEDIQHEIIGADVNDDEANLTLCLDAFHLEDVDDDDDDNNNVRWGITGVPAQQFEWEEVDDRLDADPEADNWQVFLNSHNLEPPNPASVDDLDWEVFLNVDDIEGRQDLADQFEDYGDAEHEMLFGQFADTGDSGLVQPPASKRVVENLLSVVMTREDGESDSTVCAVCKDEISVGEMVKQLPCSHYYHGDCIVPWLCIKNTCPVCRHELATDDINYERRQAERVAGDN